MANVAVLIKNFQIGGAQKQSIILGQVLKKKYNLTFIVFNGESISERFLSLAMDSGLNPYLLKGNLLKRLFSFYKVCRKNKVEILFSYLAGDNFIAGTLGKMAGIRFIIGGIRSSIIKPYKLIIQKILTNNLFAYMVFNNQTGMNALISKGFKKEKCVLIENSIHFNQEPFTRPDKDLIKIITIARFEEMKDFHTTIKAIHNLLFHNMIPPGKSILCYLIGSGSQTNSIEDWISFYNMQNYIRIVQEPPDIENYLSEADIYLSTSLFEGISNSIMEAMLYSIPIVATHVGDNFRLVTDNYNGFLVPVGDSDQISDKLGYLINNYNKRIELGLNGYALLKKRFSVERFEKTYYDLVSKLVL
jgi:glycosyltransferase involved in cell wall biosynthesis